MQFTPDAAKKAFLDIRNTVIEWLPEQFHPAINKQWQGRKLCLRPNTLLEIFCKNSTNHSMARNAFPMNEWDIVGNATFNKWDLTACVKQFPHKNYGDTDGYGHLRDALLNTPNLNTDIVAKLKDPSRSSIPIRASYAIHDGMHLLNSINWQTFFDNVDQAETVQDQTYSVIDCIHAISTPCRWIGHALAANFLKDIGHSMFFKPDTHTLDILGKSFLPNYRSLCLGCSNCELVATEWVFQFCNAVNTEEADSITPAYFDRILWFAGSGELYTHQPGFYPPMTLNSTQRKAAIATILQQATK